MDSKRLEILLNRYWSCVSTLEEEQELREYFNQNEVGDELKDVARLFQYFESERNVEKLDNSFDSNILEKIKEIKEVQKPKTRRIFFNYLKVAASLLLVITASYFYRLSLSPEDRPELMGTFEDPKQAYEETKRALILIANQMNKGKNQVEKLKMFSQAETKIKGDEKENPNEN